MKRMFMVLVVICLTLNISITSHASMYKDDTYTLSTYGKIVEALNYVTLDKQHFGLNGVDFNRLETSDPIQMYEYANGRLSRIGETYPLIFAGSIVALATSSDGENYTIETSLATKINKAISDKVAIIYDSKGVYVYDGEDIISIFKEKSVISRRGQLNGARKSEFSDVKVASIKKRSLLNYREIKPALRQSYYSCNVSYVTQNPYSNLCWAATVACIKNYKSGTNWTAGSVSKLYYDTSYVVDSTAYDSSVAGFMRNRCSLSYTYRSSRPSDNAILSNITSGYPIYGSFYVSPTSYRHAGTIYGINVISGYISVMDPISGSVSAVTNGSTYSYYNADYGVVCTLDSGIAHTW